MKERADHTQPSLGFRTIFAIIAPPEVTQITAVIDINSKDLEHINTGTKLLEPLPFFPLTIKVNPVHHPKEAFSVSPKEGTAAAPLGVPPVQPGKVLTESARVLLWHLLSSQVHPCSL